MIRPAAPSGLHRLNRRLPRGCAEVPATLALAALALTASGAPLPAPPPVIAPPDSFFEFVDAPDRDAARAFYRKFVDVAGVPVVAAPEVADEAFHRTHVIVTGMLAGRRDVFDALRKIRMYLIIIGKDQVYTDMPEYRNHPNPAFQNERVRGTGGRPTSFGEENLLGLPIDRYDDESIAVHEFCHTIDSALRSVDPEWTARRNAAFETAIGKGLWKDTYAASNAAEFWAELCQSYFDCNRVNNWNHGPIGTREQLKVYDPASYEWVRRTFNLTPAQDWRYPFPHAPPAVIAPPTRFGIDPFYTRFTWAREFPVIARAANESALIRANHAIRRMFAYRHDVLKALIADRAKLAVLGPEESIADLPECRAVRAAGVEIDALARFLDYSPELKLLVVADDSAARVRPLRPAPIEHQVVRVFARALHQVTGLRPVDPPRESLVRNRQQYELRVTRLDVRFDQKLATLYDSARGRGQWRGTAAIHDRAAYWVEGVAAYFDAVGETAAPEGAREPITSRERLAAYDPELHAFVHDTFAFNGRVDWRATRPAGAAGD